MHVVIVGAGLGGLSAACHLAGRGHDVEVVAGGFARAMTHFSGKTGTETETAPQAAGYLPTEKEETVSDLLLKFASFIADGRSHVNEGVRRVMRPPRSTRLPPAPAAPPADEPLIWSAGIAARRWRPKDPTTARADPDPS